MHESIQFIATEDISQRITDEGIPVCADEDAMSLLSLIHTEVEQVVYKLMLAETRESGKVAGAFSISHLMIASGIHNHSKIRRAREGLLAKLSIERHRSNWVSDKGSVTYSVFSPGEILVRRQSAGLSPFAKELTETREERLAAKNFAERLMQTCQLSPREAEVALKCLDGLTNAAIGKKLLIHEETVKFHLRNIFIKFGVKRRTELRALLFQKSVIGG